MTLKKNIETVLMGNEAIALGIVENGCSIATSYPGTPASEILSSIAAFQKKYGFRMHTEWSVNEKVAFEVALANSYAGGRSAVSMKQVGLNVALDSLMSSAYTGVIGGFLLISADDPGPYSSQTEQDSRCMAMFAKIPVLDPSSPREAREMVAAAYKLSEKYSLPVMVRPTTRICHARQNITTGRLSKVRRRPTSFSKNPTRWAATPKYRYLLHKELNDKLIRIASEKKFQPALYFKKQISQKLCILSSGVAYAYVLDLLNDLQLHNKIALCKVPMPYPLPDSFLKTVTGNFEKILVIEDTYPVIEMQLPDRRTVVGKLTGHIPKEGEITPDVVHTAINNVLGMKVKPSGSVKTVGQRPSLCPGCPHRAAYFAIKKALPKAIYPGDIGCYTLGINLGAVDTCLCMGASINQAAGFYHSFTASGSEGRPIVATIGDSTFLHAGITALMNAVYNGARFILVILDNSTTAMTGNQPTAATGVRADGSIWSGIKLERLLEGCGITYIKIIDPYNIPQFVELIKEAEIYTRAHEGGIAVLVARHPCLVGAKLKKIFTASISDNCTGCQFCIVNFECPAFFKDGDKVAVNPALCSGCGVCTHVCPVHAITMVHQ